MNSPWWFSHWLQFTPKPPLSDERDVSHTTDNAAFAASETEAAGRRSNHSTHSTLTPSLKQDSTLSDTRRFSYHNHGYHHHHSSNNNSINNINNNSNNINISNNTSWRSRRRLTRTRSATDLVREKMRGKSSSSRGDITASTLALEHSLHDGSMATPSPPPAPMLHATSAGTVLVRQSYVGNDSIRHNDQTVQYNEKKSILHQSSDNNDTNNKASSTNQHNGDTNERSVHDLPVPKIAELLSTKVLSNSRHSQKKHFCSNWRQKQCTSK
jgi:hypothetical protein